MRCRGRATATLPPSPLNSVLSGPIREGGMKVTATVVTCPSVSPPITRARRTGDDNDAEQTRLDLGRGDKCRRLDGQFVRYGAGGTGTDHEPERDLSEPRWCAVRHELLSVHPHSTGDEGHESRQCHSNRGSADG